MWLNEFCLSTLETMYGCFNLSNLLQLAVSGVLLILLPVDERAELDLLWSTVIKLPSPSSLAQPSTRNSRLPDYITSFIPSSSEQPLKSSAAPSVGPAPVHLINQRTALDLLRRPVSLSGSSSSSSPNCTRCITFMPAG